MGVFEIGLLWSRVMSDIGLGPDEVPIRSLQGPEKVPIRVNPNEGEIS